LPDVHAGTRQVDAARARALSPLLRPGYAVTALHEPLAHDIDVSALHQGFLRQLAQAGGRLFLDHDVVSLERRGDCWHVATSKGEFAAPVLVNAAGAWADSLARRAGVAPIGLAPCRRTVVLVEAPQTPDIVNAPMTLDIDEQFYFKPDAGLLLLSPGDETPLDPCDVQPDELDVATAIARVEQATLLQVTRIRAKWAGLRSFVTDRTPCVGYDAASPGFFWLAAQGGYGIQTAPAMGQLAAALIQHRAVPDVLLWQGVEPQKLSPSRQSRAPAFAR
jgi:D-arginine dehydrogenase